MSRPACRTVFSWSYRRLGPRPPPTCSDSSACTQDPRTASRLRPASRRGGRWRRPAARLPNSLARTCSPSMPPQQVPLPRPDPCLRTATRPPPPTARPDRQAATSRLLDYYLHTAHAAALTISPSCKPLALPPSRPGAAVEQHTDVRQATAWMEAEQDVLIALTALAAEAETPHSWQIPWTMSEFLDRRGSWNEMVALLHNALAAAAKLGDATGQVTAHHRIALASAGESSTMTTARAHLTASVQICRRSANVKPEPPPTRPSATSPTARAITPTRLVTGSRLCASPRPPAISGHRQYP